jgi:hypothetical protein
MTLDIKKTSNVVPFEISISSLSDSELEISVEEIYQDSDGNIKFKVPSSDNAKVISLEKGIDKKQLKKGEVWKLKGTYSFKNLKKGSLVDFAVMIRDRQDVNKSKKKDGIMLAKHFRYAVTIRTDTLSSKSRPSLDVKLKGIKRLENRIMFESEVINKSHTMIDFDAEATIRDEKSKKIIERVPLKFFKDKDKKRGVRLFPLNSVKLYGEIKDLNMRGRYLATVSIKGLSASFSKSSGIKPVDFSQDLYEDRKPVADRKFVGVEIDEKNIINVGFVKIKNPNFFTVKVESSILETPTPSVGKAYLINSNELIAPGQESVIKVNITDARIKKGVDSYDKKWTLKLLYLKQTGEIIGEDLIKIAPVAHGTMAEFWKGLEDSEKAVKGE